MKSEDTRKRLVKQGLQALSRDGFSGVTFGALAEASGLSKSGLFAHFRSRQALEIALLDEAAQVARNAVIEPAMAEPEGLPRLIALITRWFGWPQRAGLPGGCPVASALFELDDAEGEVRDHVAFLDAEWRSLLEALVADAAKRGHLDPTTDTTQFVWELCGIYLAHHSFSRFQRDLSAARRANVALGALLQRNGARGFKIS